MTKSIAVVEDERDVADLLRHALEKEGFEVRVYHDGKIALAELLRKPPDLVVLDWMLPGVDGLEICKALRREPRTAETPVLMLTAREEEIDQVTGLEVGADDYITKPFSPRVLAARVRTALRRRATGSSDSEVLKVGPITIDQGRHQVTADGKVVSLTATEFKLLRFLASRPGRVRTRLEIVEAVSGEVAVLERTVDAHVTSLRRKLGAPGELVETVRGVGYRLREE
ncbi:MAG: response regulator transcription factor [Planctomycetes bacterium]|nr:response regulator transcription factor [Planctomycetota bacterium]